MVECLRRRERDGERQAGVLGTHSSEAVHLKTVAEDEAGLGIVHPGGIQTDQQTDREQTDRQMADTQIADGQTDSRRQQTMSRHTE